LIEEEGQVIARGRRDGRIFVLDRTDDGLGAFIEEEGQIIARGRRDGRMFILDRLVRKGTKS
jgi:hypothetical protein